MGITPACAGKSCSSTTLSPRRRDHPRMCGEKQFYEAFNLDPPGSPPHVRGKAKNNISNIISSRITPACAGKRSVAVVKVCADEDHPRMCGEKLRSTSSGRPQAGSPPHVRGKGSQRCPVCRPGRITPACAGKRLKKASYCLIVKL